MDWRLAKKLSLELFLLQKALEANALDGRLLYGVTHHTQPIQLAMAKGDSKCLSFHLFNSPQHPLILGLPLLIQHNRYMDGSTGEVLV